MIIDPGSPGFNKTSGATTGNTRLGGVKTAAPATGNGPEGTAKAVQDSVSLSSEGRALGKLEQAVIKSSDVDTAKVARIKQAIADGVYKPNSSAIADKMLSQDEQL